MDGRKPRYGITLMIFYRSFDVMVHQVAGDFKFLTALLFEQLFKHTLNYAANGQFELFVYFLFISFAFAFNGCLILFSKLSQQLPY